MRRSLLISTVIALSLLGAKPSAPQASTAQAAPAELTAQYNMAMQAKDWPAALAFAQQLVGTGATSANLLLLANAQLYGGAAEDSLATYERSLAAAEQEKPAKSEPDAAWKDGMAKIYIGKGNALLKLKRMPEALDAYNRSAELSSNPGQAYFNICAVFYNNGDTANGPNACRKAAAVDPTHANTWFVLGSYLFTDAKIDPQGKVTLTDECRNALNKYLELAPDGPHAADVKAMLDMAGN